MISIMVKSYVFNVYGNVQGIGFRKKIKRFADENKIFGNVKNDSDGSVSICMIAEEENMENFKEFLKKFSVRNFDSKEVIGGENFKEFKIIKNGGFFYDKFFSVFNLLKYSFGFSHTRNYLYKIPIHLAIIPDGNRRWSRKKGLLPSRGHYEAGSSANIKSLLNESKRLGVKYVSVWGFSTENWKREPEEIKEIFNLLLERVKEFKEKAKENRIRFRHFGRKDRMPIELVKELTELEKETKKYSDFNVQLCFDYGGRDEILRVVNKLLKSRKNKNLNEAEFSEKLDSIGVPDPDLIIRTSGEKRLSGFMPFQAVYSELYFVDKYFPDFSPKDLRKAVFDFSKRKRRFGN